MPILGLNIIASDSDLVKLIWWVLRFNTAWPTPDTPFTAAQLGDVVSAYQNGELAALAAVRIATKYGLKPIAVPTNPDPGTT